MTNNSKDNLINNEERIDRYIKGLMTEDEEIAFVNDVKKDETLRSQTEAIAQLTKAMYVVGNANDREIINEIKSKKTRHHTRTYWAVAACILCLCILSIKGYDYMNVTGLGDDYCNTFPTSTIIRGVQDQNVENKLKVLFSNVEKGEELTSTLTQLTKLWQESLSDTYNDYTDYSPYIGWYLAIGHLKNYDEQNAKKVLQRMEQLYPANTAVGDKVRELLKKL